MQAPNVCSFITRIHWTMKQVQPTSLLANCLVCLHPWLTFSFFNFTQFHAQYCQQVVFFPLPLPLFCALCWHHLEVYVALVRRHHTLVAPEVTKTALRVMDLEYGDVEITSFLQVGQLPHTAAS